MLKEFGDFIKRGNVMDLAVAVIIGGAFGAIVTSLVNDILMPLIGIILGGINFTEMVLQVGSATLTYGNFIQAIVNFLVIAWVIFMLVRTIKNMEKQEEAAPAAPPAPSAEEKLLTEIRDLLKRQAR
ncbi:MAG: large-conductance mechanosensitive channel protein MscL [Anaerolineales bacterium]|nr:large-conductance mechanosensitive channel protein MscL [Anaerolineales bacterium]MCA9997620.1 large-conductance mechanosensitive channel protein MscL [Anaerolineales bacterium]